MVVPVPAGLLDEGDLIHAAGFELAQMRAQIVRRADSTLASRQRPGDVDVLGLGILQRLELLPEVGAAGLVFTEGIETAERETERT